MREPSECSTEEISDVKTASQLNEWEHCDPAGRCGDGRASTASPRKNGPKDDVAPYVSNGRHGNVTDSVHSSQRKDVEQRLDAKSNGSQLERQQVQVLKRNDELSRNGDDGRSPLPIKKRRAPEDDATADVSSTDTGPENGTVVHSTSRELDGLPNSPLHDNNKRELSQLSDGGDRTTNSKKAKRDILRQARSERKRCREKQRRSDVNKGFEDLTALLMKIDPAASSRRADDTSGDGLDEDGLDKSDSQDDNGAAAPTNRVELIGLTVNVMERLYKENLEMKDKLRKLGAGTPVPQIHADDLGNKGQHQVDKDVRSTANRRNNPDEVSAFINFSVELNRAHVIDY